MRRTYSSTLNLVRGSPVAIRADSNQRNPWHAFRERSVRGSAKGSLWALQWGFGTRNLALILAKLGRKRENRRKGLLGGFA
jgi:hypothetical protein